MMFASRNRQRVRPTSNFELYAGFFMRISGLILLVVAVFHLLFMHLTIGVENIDFETIAGRWESPFWRLFDLFLLTFALSHGVNGTRQVMDDYVHARGWRLVVRTLIYTVGFVIAVLGAYVIFTFETPV
jgi:succinate dehydrogenase / fumarate reductase, membrane anchor subunit